MVTKIKKFEAEWCGQCKVMDNVLAKMTNIQVEHIDVNDLSEDELSELGIRNIPVCLLYNENGEMVERVNGIKTYEQLSKIIAQHE